MRSSNNLSIYIPGHSARISEFEGVAQSHPDSRFILGLSDMKIASTRISTVTRPRHRAKAKPRSIAIFLENFSLPSVDIPEP